jgi:hypothetical protein
MRREALTPDVTVDGSEEETVEFGPRKKRTRKVVVAAVAAAVVVNAGAVWAYWHFAGAGTGAGNRVEMELRARTSLSIPLRPGTRGDLVVSVTNVNAFPIRITEVTPGNGGVVAEGNDDACNRSGISLVHASTRVNWEVPRNTVGAFTLPGSVTMSRDVDAGCDGAAYFTVPIRASGTVD